MNKINNYFRSVGLSLVFMERGIYEHTGGRSFNNNGTYTEDTYRIVGTPYTLRAKISGRKVYTILKGETLEGIEFNQHMFIEKVLKALFRTEQVQKH